jgi:hypothetical protein
MLEKMNMAIGTFFSEVGTDLIKYFSLFDPACGDIGKELAMAKRFTDREFINTSKYLKNYDCTIITEKEDLGNVKRFLMSKREFLLRLLANPNLLEHDSFTNLLWAVFHLTDELAHRKDVKKLPEADYKHLAGDIKRAYVLLLSEWTDYMKHLKHNYPYLFSLAMRMNPFDANAKPEVV